MSALRVPLGAWDANIPLTSSLLRTKCSPAAPVKFLSLFIAWNKAVGDVIAVGDDLMEVETDKATVQVPSPVAGTLLEIFFKDGDEIKTGDAIAICESN